MNIANNVNKTANEDPINVEFRSGISIRGFAISVCSIYGKVKALKGLELSEAL